MDTPSASTSSTKALQRMAKFWENAKSSLLDLISCGLYVADVVTDILLAISFYANGDAWYFSLTLTFILLAAITSNIVSLFFSCHQLQNENKSKIHYVWVTLLHCCLLGMLHNYAFAIRHGKSHPDSENIKLGIIIMGIIEILLESGPQLILQLYILIANAQIINPQFQTDDYAGISKRNSTALVGDDDFLQKLTSTTVIFQALSIVTSLTAIAWVITKFSIIVNDTTEWKNKICYLIWHLFSIVARVFAVSLFASVFTFWTPIIVICRYFILGIVFYAYHKKSNGCNCTVLYIGFIFGLIHIFSYFDLDDSTRERKFAILYFIYDLIENSLLVGLWCWVIDSATNNFMYLALGVYVSCMVLGFIFMVIHLKYFIKNVEKQSDESSEYSQPAI